MAGDKSWHSPNTKYRKRCALLSEMGQGVVITALYYRIFCVSVLTYIMQLREVPAFILTSETEMLRLLIPGPGKWISRNTLFNLPEVFGLPAKFPALSALSIAVRARVALQMLPQFERHITRIEKSLAQDDAPVLHRWREWHQACMAMALKSGLDVLKDCGILVHRKVLDGDAFDVIDRKRGSLQWALCRAVSNLLIAPPHVENLVRSRMRRWAKAGLVTVPEGVAARRAEKILTCIRKVCPPCVTWAVIRTWLNGWCTMRRFQNRQSNSCLLACSCKGEDSIEHYLRCPVVRSIAREKVGLGDIKSDPGYLLLFDENREPESIALAATLLYAIYTTTNRQRHLQHRLSEHQGKQQLWCAIRKAGLQSRRLSTLLRQAWAR